MASKNRRKKRLGRPRKQDRPSGAPSSRERILEAASALFVARGTSATTMQQVAAEAGFTVGALYRHFGGKPDLLLGVVAAALERIPLFQASAIHARGRLAEVVGVYVTPEADRSRRIAREVHAVARRDRQVRKLLDAFNRRVRSALAARIAELGAADPVAPPDVIADLLLVIVLGLAHLDTLAPDRCDRPEFRAAVEKAVDRILATEERR
jgi:AcrR family transcriptional regulator